MLPHSRACRALAGCLHRAAAAHPDSWVLRSGAVSFSQPSSSYSTAAPQQKNDDIASTSGGNTKQADLTNGNNMLVRDFIQNSLYHPTHGFFNRPVPVVGTLDQPINYWKIYCKQEWQVVVNKKYQELQVSFLTPAELFSPAYGHCLARHICEHRKHNLGQEGMPFVVFEIGGGNGTLARDILDWVKANKPEEYEQMSYTCVEISSRLAEKQYETVIAKGGHAGRFKVHRGNAWDRSTWGTQSFQHTFIIMMEVLDNLPHDRVFRSSPSEPWQESAVQLESPPPSPPAASRPATSSSSSSSSRSGWTPGSALPPSMELTHAWARGPWKEVQRPLSDPLVSRCLAATYRAPTREEQWDKKLNKLLEYLLHMDGQKDAGGEVVWVPTACMALLETLHEARPNHCIIAADFDMLPDVKVEGAYAPLVSEKRGGQNIDYDSIYVPWGTADIFFPTDFEALGRVYKAAARQVWGEEPGAAVTSSHYRQGAVMKRYKEMFNTATICAFNPMVDDFLNARFFFGDSLGRGREQRQRQAATQVGTPARLVQASLLGQGQVKPPPPGRPGLPPGLGKLRPQEYEQGRQQQGQQGQAGAGQQPGAAEPTLGGRRLRDQKGLK